MLPRRDLLEGPRSRGPRSPDSASRSVAHLPAQLSAFPQPPSAKRPKSAWHLWRNCIAQCRRLSPSRAAPAAISRSDQAAEAGEPAPLALIEVSGNSTGRSSRHPRALIDQHRTDPLSLGMSGARRRGALDRHQPPPQPCWRPCRCAALPASCKPGIGARPRPVAAKPDREASRGLMPLPPLVWSPGARWPAGTVGTHPRRGGDLTKPRAAKRERVQLEGRGELVLDRADRTKRDRWRLQLTRRR